MKLEPRRVAAFLRDPGAARIVLLHGEDHGLIRDRGSLLVKAVAGRADDPFDVVELDREAIGALPGEMTSQSLTGRRRVIRVREATDVATDAVKRALAGPGQAFCVLEAGGLAARSKLRTLVEGAADAMALACYPLEHAAASALAAATLRDMAVAADADALAWLGETVTGDQALLLREVEKFGVFIGRGGRGDLEAAMLSVGDFSGLSVEDALFAATAGDVARADRGLETAMAEGVSPVGLLRAALMHVHRLLQARLLVDGGLAPSEAIKRLRPPIYFRRVAAFSRALTVGRPADFETMAQYLGDAELACKRTGAPGETLARNAILAVARRVAVSRRG